VNVLIDVSPSSTMSATLNDRTALCDAEMSAPSRSRTLAVSDTWSPSGSVTITSTVSGTSTSPTTAASAATTGGSEGENIHMDGALSDWTVSMDQLQQLAPGGRRAPAMPPGAADGADPYQVLGLSRKVSDDEIKKTYRTLIRENHPDTLIAQGMPQEFIDVANEKMAAINAAYDAVEKERGLK